MYELSSEEEEEEEERMGEDSDRSCPAARRMIGKIEDLLYSFLLAMVIEWLNNHSQFYVYLEEKLNDRQEPGPQLVPANSATEQSQEKRLMKLLRAVYYATLANTQYICYLLIILNITVNGGALSLIYAGLLFLWGLLSIPWSTKRFWLTLMFYNMSVILIKYGFQFQQVDWPGSPESGLYWPRVLGVEKKDDFAIWDTILLVSLFFHRYFMQVGAVPYQCNTSKAECV